MDIHTIGHSNHTWDSFAALLRQHSIQVLVDVRSNPSSRYAPFANARTLPGLLDRERIRYIHLGDSLGGKPVDASAYDSEGKPDYRRIRTTGLFQTGIKELLDMAEDSTIAVMCAEEDPTKCHRRLLIGPALEEIGVKLHHIRKDGTVQGSENLGSKAAYRSQLQGMLGTEGVSPVAERGVARESAPIWPRAAGEEF